MYRGNGSRLFPIVIVLIVVAVAIAALVSAGRAIFGGESTSTDQVDTSRSALLNMSADRSVRMTVRGPIVADENFRSYQVTVNQSSRTLTTHSGYLEQVINTKSLGNYVKSYEQFVYALDRANLTKGEAFTGEKDDTRGICATGRVYEFEVIQGGAVVKRLWTSTCKGSPGSLKASSDQLQKLFLEQIPDNKKLLDEVKLSSSGMSLF